MYSFSPSIGWFNLIRAGREREAEIPYDRRLEEFSNDQRRLGHPSLPRAGLPCPRVQVSVSTTRLPSFFLSFSPRLRTRGKRQAEIPFREQHKRSYRPHRWNAAAPLPGAGVSRSEP